MRRRKEGPGVAPCGSLHELFCDELPVKDVSIRTIAWSDKPSPHMTPNDMFSLAKDIDAVLAEASVLGAVVLHGTDLLAETSFMLDMIITSKKPVVTTGSMRHMEETGYDGQRNLFNSILVCLAMPSSSEVVLQMADKMFTARDAIKLDSVSVDPFIGQQRGKIGRIVNEKPEFSQNIHCDRPRLPFIPTNVTEDVPLISSFPGISALFMSAALGEISDGFTSKSAVIEGFGAGNIPPAVVPVLTKYIASGKTLVLASRCVLGGVSTIYGYDGGAAYMESLGAISAGSLSGTKAKLLLQLCMSNGITQNIVTKIFLDTK